MKTLHLFWKTKTMDRLLQWGGVGLLVWLAVLVLGAGAQTLHTSGKAAAAIREYQRLQTEAARPRQGGSDQIRRLQRNNLFVAAPSRTQLPQTQAILGDAVLIGDRWYRQGQEVQGFQIVAIGPDHVTVLNDGQEQRLVPFNVEVNYGGSRGTTAAGGSGDRGRDAREGDRGQRGPGQRPGGFGGGPVPMGGMMEMRERIENMTPEQRRETFEQFRNASPEERERMRDEFMRGRGL